MFNGRLGQPEATSVGDRKAYEAYRQWCAKFGYTAKDLMGYLQTTASIQHAPINWSGAK